MIRATIAMMLVLTTGTAGASMVWTEQGDAGELVGTHQTPTGTGSLDTIDGVLGNNTFGLVDVDVDVYCVYIATPGLFSATVALAAGSPTMASILQLWLFDSNGIGITSQEGFYLSTPTKITGSFVNSAGKYYLAVSDHDIVPYTALSQTIWSVAPRSIETPPNGSGSGPLASWSPFGFQNGTGQYSIELTGTGFCCQPLPEPGTLLLAAFALAGLVGKSIATARKPACASRSRMVGRQGANTT